MGSRIPLVGLRVAAHDLPGPREGLRQLDGGLRSRAVRKPATSPLLHAFTCHTYLCVSVADMETQNVTLSLSKELLRKVKILAVHRGTSISGLLAGLLEDVVRGEDAYTEAWARAKKDMESGFNMGTGGKVAWNRDELHER